MATSLHIIQYYEQHATIIIFRLQLCVNTDMPGVLGTTDNNSGCFEHICRIVLKYQNYFLVLNLLYAWSSMIFLHCKE